MNVKAVKKLTIFIENKCRKKKLTFLEKLYLGKRLGRFKSGIVALGKATYCYKVSGETSNIDVILSHRSEVGEIHISFSSTFSEKPNGVEIMTIGKYRLHADVKGDYNLFMHITVTDEDSHLFLG